MKIRILSTTHFVRKLVFAALLCLAANIYAQSTVTISKTAGTTIIIPAYAEFSLLKITGAAALEAADWDVLKKLTINYRLELNAATQEIPARAFLYYYSYLLIISGSNVTSIGTDAFTNCYTLQEISFPEATTIENRAFYNCSNLGNVTLPKVTSIGDYTFLGCSNFSDISFPLLQTIGSYAFMGSGCSAISLPNATTIGNSAFAACTNLEYVSLPMAQSIGNSAFGGCPRLVGIVLPVVRSIENNAFGDCSALAGASFPLAESVGQYAFFGCLSLYSISIPAVTTIAENAFENCTALKYMMLGNNPPQLTESGLRHSFKGVFAPLQLLVSNSGQYANLNGYPPGTQTIQASLHIVEKIYNNPINLPVISDGDIMHITSIFPLESIDWQALNQLSKTFHLALSSSFGIEISAGAFQNNRYLLSVRSPNGGIIRQNAFNGCTSLTTFDMSVSGVEQSAFSGCSALTRVFLYSTSRIFESAFSGCTSLTEAFLLNSYMQIEARAFENCTSLKRIMLGEMLPTIADNSFAGVTQPLQLLVPNLTNYTDLSKFPSGTRVSNGITVMRTTVRYPTVLPMNGDTVWVVGHSSPPGTWSWFKELGVNCHLVLEQDTHYLPDNAFQNHQGLLSVKGVNTVAIGQQAFSGCTGLTEINFPAVKTIGNNAFSFCSRLTEANFPQAQSISDAALMGCLNITKVYLPRITYLGEYALMGCVKLTEIDLPMAKNVGANAFNGCKDIKTASLYGITYLGLLAFDGCTSLKAIQVSASNTEYTTIDGVLYDKSVSKVIAYPPGKKLNGYVAPSTVTSIATSAFPGCPYLSSVSATSLTHIETGAFDHCTRLLFIELSATPPEVAANGFLGMDDRLQLLVSDVASYVDLSKYPPNTIVVPRAMPTGINDILINGSIDSTGNVKATMARPVAYATVILYGKAKAKAIHSDDLRSQYPYLVAMTQADENGVFKFDVPRGEYLMWIEMPGYTVTSTLQVGLDDSKDVYNVSYSLDELNNKISAVTGVTAISDPEAVKATIYPNPAADDMVRITVDVNVPYVIKVYNAIGQLMLSANSSSPESVIDISNWQAGIYFVKVEAGGKTGTYKLMKN